MSQETLRLDTKERAEKRERLFRLGADPYPPAVAQQKRASVLELADRFSSLNAGEKTDNSYSLAGRLMRRRDMGKAAFFNIQDESGSLQCYIKKQDFLSSAEGRHEPSSSPAPLKAKPCDTEQRELSQSLVPSKANPDRAESVISPWELWRLCDIGDIVTLKGRIFKTRKGELSLRVSDLHILCKSLRSLPEKHHGLQDKELKYRFRHLDLIMDSHSREVFKIRSQVIAEIRSFMHKKGFMEVETPVLQPLYGGAEAQPFETWFRRLNQKMYLKISPEIYLKKLVVGGFEKIFEIGKNFRNEGLDRSHNPEFTMMEYYEAYTDYEYQMAQFEELVCCVCQAVHQWRLSKNLSSSKESKTSLEGQSAGLRFLYQERKLDLTRPWMRISLQEFEQVVESTQIESTKGLNLLYPLGWDSSSHFSEQSPVAFKEKVLAPVDFWAEVCRAFQRRRQAFLQKVFDNKEKTKEDLTKTPEKKLTDKSLSSYFWKSFTKALLKVRTGNGGKTKEKNPIVSEKTSPFLSLKEKIEKMKNYTRFLDPHADLSRFLSADFDYRGQNPRVKEGDSLSKQKSFDQNKGRKSLPANPSEKKGPDFILQESQAEELYHELSLKALELTVEKFFWDPVFVIDFPVSVSPLTKQHRSQPGLVERFEPYIAGLEIGNAYTELNDPVEQRRRLEQQKHFQVASLKEPVEAQSLPDKKSLSVKCEDSSFSQMDPPKGFVQKPSIDDPQQESAPYESKALAQKPDGDLCHPVDESFLQALETGMPPTGGVGLGVERLVMILSDQRSIKDSMLFPMLRRKPAK